MKGEDKEKRKKEKWRL